MLELFYVSINGNIKIHLAAPWAALVFSGDEVLQGRTDFWPADGTQSSIQSPGPFVGFPLKDNACSTGDSPFSLTLRR